jgi:hypothetical protein
VNASFSDIQQSVAKRLARFPQFASVAILHERLKDFSAEVDRALGGFVEGKSPGLFLLVGTPTAAVAREQVAGPNLELIVAVTASENVLTNMSDAGTRLPAADAALGVLRCLVGFQPAGTLNPLMPAAPGMRVIDDPFDPERLCYLATMKTQVFFAPERLAGEGAFVKE